MRYAYIQDLVRVFHQVQHEMDEVDWNWLTYAADDEDEARCRERLDELTKLSWALDDLGYRHFQEEWNEAKWASSERVNF
jgi:hypothetical protein